MASKYDPAIDKGIALLDAKVPEWCTKMQLDHLEMANGDSCVLGQIFAGRSSSESEYGPSYYVGSDFLGLPYWSEEHGFFTHGPWAPLTRRWKQRIRQHCAAHDEVRRAGES